MVDGVIVKEVLYTTEDGSRGMLLMEEGIEPSRLLLACTPPCGVPVERGRRAPGLQ